MPPSAHPYMANSAPALKQELLEATGATSVEELFEQIPASHRLRGELRLPPALVLGGRAAPPPARAAAQEPELRGDAQLPRRRLLAAPRARDLRRAGRPHRVRHLDLGDALLRPRPQPDLVRVREPARRAGRHGLRRDARLQLRLRGRARDPHGVAHDRPPRGARTGLDGSRAPGGHPHLLRAARDGAPHRRRARRPRSRDGPARPRRPRAQALRRRPRPCTSRTPPTSA